MKTHSKYIVVSLICLIFLCTVYVSNIREGFVPENDIPEAPIHYITKDRFDQMIDKDKDGYLKSLSQADLTIRIAKDVDEYKRIAKNSFCPESSLTDSLKKKIHHCCSDIEEQLGEYVDDYLYGVSIKKFLELPWKFAIICDNKYENGYPHTRDDIIVVSKNIINSYSKEKLAKLFIHEKTHVYQKKYPKVVAKYLKENGFIKTVKRSTFLDPANPDLDEYRYSHPQLESFYSKYKTSEPSSFHDIQYVRDKTSSEHPLEYLAYKMEKIYDNKLPIEDLESQLLDDNT